MKLSYILIIFCISSGSLFSQQMPINFSGNFEAFTAFGGSGFSFTSNPSDSNDEVGQFFNDGSMAWQGFFLDLSSSVMLSEEQELTLNFYQYDPQQHSITLKLENGTDVDVEVTLLNSGSGWSNDLVFDFSNATISGTSNTINAIGSYSRITIFIDGGTTTTGTYLIDDINNGSEPSDPHALDIHYTELVWADEFDVDGGINSDNWFHQTQLPAGGSWFNGEQQHYTNRIENSFVENGFLNIVAIKENFTDQGETKEYTSARLNSKFAFAYGRIDVRAKMPEGTGTWPAIWTLGKNIDEDGGYWDNQGFGTTSWPACGEIDIMEHGLHATNEVSCALHSPSSFGGTVNTATQMLSDVANNFHVYSVNWSPNQITFLIDDVGYYTYSPADKNPDTWPFDDEHYILLNIAMGGIAGSIDSGFTQSSMIIDYVRVYQNSSLSVDEVIYGPFYVYPNPASDILNIDTVSEVDSLVMYNVMGQEVLSQQNSEKKLNVSTLNSGIYILKITSNDREVIKKIVINN
ncbi:MAG: family 16 glycosylhydrolase [Winogradskyella sp.]|uniref:family 16 glycosylhydrolase n=1 Tax=Winogradskyella sp. TaxID=1883156 RepID=UPI001821E6B2|nr:family 16 glycosylhydrolase [Winogradskyella sp.]